MRWTLERISDPEIEPVTAAEMVRHLGEFADVANDADLSDDLELQIQAAREWVERYTGRVLVDQTWRLSLEQPGVITGDSVGGYTSRPGYYAGQLVVASFLDQINLRLGPVLAIQSFVTVGADGEETAIDSGTYELREASGRWPRIVPLNGATWGVGSFRITFRAGYADRTGSPQHGASVIPARFRQAIKLHVEAHYDRERIKELTEAATNLIRPERTHLGMA